MINRWVKESGTIEIGYDFPPDTFSCTFPEVG